MTILTRVLADHAASIDVERLPSVVSETARRCVLDLMSAAIAGSGSPAPSAIRRVAGHLHGTGNAVLWFCSQHASLHAALLHNGAAASALDLDDGSRAARGHPGSSVIPAVLTLAGMTPAVSQFDILSAIIAGYDVGVRIAAAQKIEAIRTRQTGRWAALASAAAIGRLLRVPAQTIAQALAIAGVLAPNQRANGSSGYSRDTGNLVKEGIAFSAATGVQSLFLAMEGFTGPIDLLDHPDFYDGDRIVGGLGRSFEIMGTYFKPYACCRYIHPALDALVAMTRQTRLSAPDVASIRVETFGFALRLGNSLDPQNLVDLQYSLPYCLAVLMSNGEQALLPIDEGLLHRPDIQRLAQKVELIEDREAEARFPIETLARLTVTTRSGRRLVSELTAPRGDPARPMDWQALENKFRAVSRRNWASRDQDRMITAISELGQGRHCELLQMLEALPTTSASRQPSSSV